MNSISRLSITILSALLFWGGSIATSQGQSWKFGLTAGMNLSSHINNFYFADGDISLQFNPDITIGYQGGILIRKNFGESFRIQLEPSAILLGAKYDNSFTVRGSEFRTDSRTELIYIQMPLVFQLSTNPPNRTVFGRDFVVTTYHLTGGIYGGYLPYANFNGTNTGSPIGIPFEGNFSNNVISQYSKYDGGALFGIGLERGSYNKIGFETRAIYSVIDSGSMPTNFEPQNIALTFSIYYLF